MHALLRRVLAAHLVDPEEPPADPNFSLHVAEDNGRRGTKDFHLLYKGVTAIVRTRDLRRLVDGLLGYLSAARERPDDQTLRFDVAAFVKDGRAVLAPASLKSSLATIERRLNAKGLRVVDRPWACVDLAGNLVLPEPQLSLDRPALDELTSGGAVDAAVGPGRYPLVGWGFGLGRHERGPISRALALTLAAARLIDRASLDLQSTLDRLALVLGRVQPVALWADRPEGLVDPLVALASGSTV